MAEGGAVAAQAMVDVLVSTGVISDSSAGSGFSDNIVNQTAASEIGEGQGIPSSGSGVLDLSGQGGLIVEEEKEKDETEIWMDAFKKFVKVSWGNNRYYAPKSFAAFKNAMISSNVTPEEINSGTDTYVDSLYKWNADWMDDKKMPNSKSGYNGFDDW
jgi:hypothetical protein